MPVKGAHIFLEIIFDDGQFCLILVLDDCQFLCSLGCIAVEFFPAFQSLHERWCTSILIALPHSTSLILLACASSPCLNLSLPQLALDLHTVLWRQEWHLGRNLAVCGCRSLHEWFLTGGGGVSQQLVELGVFHLEVFRLL